jgi:hypothetical protein
MNQLVAQESRCLKRPIKPRWGGSIFHGPRSGQGDAVRHLCRQGQRERGAKGEVLARYRVINPLFGLAASRALTPLVSLSHSFLQHNPMALTPAAGWHSRISWAAHSVVFWKDMPKTAQCSF